MIRRLAIVLALFIAIPARADRPNQADVEKLAKPLVELKWCQGIAIGLIDVEGSRVFGFGTMSESDARKPDGDTVFEVGSVTKAFTGTLLAEMSLRGEVSLDDHVSKYLPKGMTTPGITLAHLATHSSGLPRMPTNFRPGDLSNPYADYTVDQMYAFLRDFKPKRKPGEQYEYSNLGMGLLGHALSYHTGKSYESLVTERVIRPLKMSDTKITLDDAEKKRLAAGHDADGVPIANWDFPTLTGCGAIRSTVNDLLKLVAASIDLDSTPLGKPLKLAQTPRASAMPENKIGLGWHIGREGTLIWHNGQTGGYHAYVAVAPEKKIGVVILANTGTDLIDALGYQLVNRMLDEPSNELVLRKEKSVKPDVLEQRVGRFLLTPIFALMITRKEDRLYCQATDQPKFRIYPESETEFFYKAVNAQITFKLNDAGRAYMLTLHQNGLNLPGIRADGPATAPATTNRGDK